MTDSDQRGRPSTGPANPAVAETHISTVFFSSNRAYKLLKPLRTSFLDHSTVAARLQAVDVELQLNRRLAPDVYLGTADIIEHGVIADRMLVMRRLPDGQRLTAIIDRGGDLRPWIRAIARAIAVFHEAQPPQRDAKEIAGRDALATNWNDNFADIRPVVGSVLSAVDVERSQALVENYLKHSSALFDGRLANGYVRDGHGDLTAEDIFCLPDGPRILDCLAFDPKLRIGDKLLDVAFLAMDLERLAGPAAADDLFRMYTEFSNEHHPSSLAHHFVAYRASVRAKVAAIRFGQGEKSQAELVRTYHDLCLRHLEKAELSVIMVGGSPGTGKTTLSEGLSSELGHILLTTDELRKDLVGLGHLDRAFGPADEGIYSTQTTDRTYAELARRAKVLLDQGESVILDASWNRNSHRELIRQLAGAKAATLVEFECVLDAEVAKERIASRLRAGNDPSDARPELVDELRQRFEAWPTAHSLDSDATGDDVLALALRHLDHRGISLS